MEASSADVATQRDSQPTPVKSAIPLRIEQFSHVSAHEELLRIRTEMPAIFERAGNAVACGSLGLIGWGLSLPRVQRVLSEHEDKPWYFVGDIHGDFLAWHRLWTRVQADADFRLCFLGDLIDRGPLNIECFAGMLEAVERYPNRILWIKGNHDSAVRWNGSDGKFYAAHGISPAEFVGWLNDESRREQVRMWGRLFEDVVSRLPYAVLFRDGLLATHGGVPLNDRWKYLKTMEAFHHERCLEDFIWTRPVNYPKRVGWTTERRQCSSDFGLGYKDLEDFCRAVESVFPVKRVVHGHEHIQDGCERPDCYKAVPLLTLNGFGFDYLNSSVRNYRKSLVFGVGKPDSLPKVDEVPVSAEEHAQIYPSHDAVTTESVATK